MNKVPEVADLGELSKSVWAHVVVWTEKGNTLENIQSGIDLSLSDAHISNDEKTAPRIIAWLQANYGTTESDAAAFLSAVEECLRDQSRMGSLAGRERLLDEKREAFDWCIKHVERFGEL